MDTFKGKDIDEMRQLSTKNYCELVIVPHNLTIKFQPLDISVNQAAKSFISNKFNTWNADGVSKQMPNGIVPGYVKVSLKWSYLNLRRAKWIIGTYNHLRKQNNSIIKGFDAAGIIETIKFANDVFKSRKSFYKNLCVCFWLGSLF